VTGKLQRGGTVADVGCGHGASTILMAQAFPASTFVGSDYHEGSITTARERAAQAGVSDRVRFEIAPASSYSGTGYDLVTMFDCLHDMGDPVGDPRRPDAVPPCQRDAVQHRLRGQAVTGARQLPAARTGPRAAQTRAGHP
jgi:SAM-dependent methyltransferase